MHVSQLNPAASLSEAFRGNCTKFVPETRGCYALCSSIGTILYIGLADNLRRRMAQHLENPEKTSETPAGRAVLFYWLEARNIEALEKAWMNEHIGAEGGLPVLNKIFSPVG
jgi:predicted GIY-YIG superfamily endonuclease